MTDKADSAKDLQDREIAAALARQAPARPAPSYHGPCMMCGGDIPTDRRLAAPGSAFCHPCATQKEKR